MKVRILVLATSLLFLGSCTMHQTQGEGGMQNTLSRKEQVVALLKTFETGDSVLIAYINPEKYIQHNLQVADGVEGFREAIRGAEKSGVKVNTLRVFEDGDYVFAQTLTSRPDDSIELTFDIFRYEGDKIVEHWDNSSVFHAPSDTAVFQSAYIGNISAVTDLDKCAENKALAEGFMRTVVLQDSIERFPEFADTASYTEHNPYIQEGMMAMLLLFADGGQSFVPSTIHKVLGEGDYVLVVSEKSVDGVAKSALYDLFRFSNGKIVEHWNILEAIPPQTEWKNTNGKFGF